MRCEVHCTEVGSDRHTASQAITKRRFVWPKHSLRASSLLQTSVWSHTQTNVTVFHNCLWAHIRRIYVQTFSRWYDAGEGKRRLNELKYYKVLQRVKGKNENSCNENQLNALFILSLFRQSTPTCFGLICSPSSGAILYIYSNWRVLCFLVDCLSPKKHNTYQFWYIRYNSWWWAANMPETCRGWLTD
jgi:hypothetical protein